MVLGNSIQDYFHTNLVMRGALSPEGGRGMKDGKENRTVMALCEVKLLGMTFFLASEKLPKDKEYVLAHLLLKDNWSDSDDPHGKRYWQVVKFVRGISKEEREKMKNGEIPDPVDVGYSRPTPPGVWVEHKNKRSSVYASADEYGNNLVPYIWEPFGPSSYLGQAVDVWARLPIISGEGGDEF